MLLVVLLFIAILMFPKLTEFYGYPPGFGVKVRSTPYQYIDPISYLDPSRYFEYAFQKNRHPSMYMQLHPSMKHLFQKQVLQPKALKKNIHLQLKPWKSFGCC